MPTSAKRRSRRATHPTPEPLYRLGTAFWSSGVLFAAHRLTVFDVLDAQPRTVAELAGVCGLTPDGAGKLLTACLSLGLVACDEAGRYRNSPLAGTFLVRGKPTYQGHLLDYLADLWARFGELEYLLQTGESGPRETAFMLARPDAERQAAERAWVLAMHEIAMGGQAEALCRAVDLSGYTRLLDVSGGSGTYAIRFAEQYPTLTAEVLDLPEVLAVAEDLIRQSSVGDRVRIRPGDFVNADYGGGYDVVLLSGVLHGLGERHILRVLKKAYAALNPGGCVIVQEMTPDAPSPTAAQFAALFSLNMMSGGTYSAEQIALWLNQSGFLRIRVTPLEQAWWFDHVVLGRKP
ncbi:MAG: acetylserotonin O-methyltransferase [Chloracidobacterium sp.]|nr:acetylserotonin O-methyltransferase [Chloracidobacterium sp.]MDW8218677.1 methyltransferase [Acidobacteriota bacterium]